MRNSTAAKKATGRFAGMRSMAVYLVFASLLLTAGAFAANEPLLQIASYSTLPTTVYPGTSGYMQITLTNSGVAIAQSVTAYYNYDGLSKTVAIGDINIGSTAQISVPFKISQYSSGGIQLLNADIYYGYDSGTAAANKMVSLSVPVTVLQYKPLQVLAKTSGVAAIAPGENLLLPLELKNTGGVVNNLIISMPANSTFAIEGANQQSVGSIPQNGTASVLLSLVSSSDAKTGTYSIPVVFSYQDAISQPTEETIYLGPIHVLDRSTQYGITLEPLESVEIGAQVPFRLTIENLGSSPMSGTLDINATSTFTPIGVQRIYFDSVEPGKSVSKEIVLGVLSTQSAGYYTLPLTLTPFGGAAATYNAGIFVQATPEITVNLDSTSSSVQIANTGNCQVRSVYASATSNGQKSESFIGTLNVDDFATLSLLTGSGRSVDVVISYRDSNNAQHTISETLETTGNSSFAGQGNRTTAGAGSTNAIGSQQRNPLGFLFGQGGRSATGTTSSGFGLLPIAIGVVIVAGVGYFAYKKYWKGKKKPPEGAKR